MARTLSIVLFLLAVALSTLPGCGSGATPLTTEERHLKALGVLTGQYRGSHQGKPPPNLEALKAHVAKADAKALTALDIDPSQREAMFTSTRDNKPFVYRPPTSAAPKMGPDGKPIQHVLFHEAEGAGGKRWVAYDLGRTELVADSKFQELISQKP